MNRISQLGTVVLSASIAVVNGACTDASNEGKQAAGAAGSTGVGGTNTGGTQPNASGGPMGGSAGASGTAGAFTGMAGKPEGGSGGGSGVRPAGWLYTDGAKLKVADGKGAGAVWMGRGVNTDDVFFCGYNYDLWMPDPGAELKQVLAGLLTDWKPNFIRLSLSMASYGATVSFLTDVDKYRKPMIDVVKSIGQHPGVYVLLVLRSDASMIGQDHEHGDPEATGIPSDGQTTPDPNAFPSGTDAVYAALVDAFKDDAFVMFGLTNEPGGNLLPSAQIRSALDHAASTIRAEEDKLGVPHHIISVQGQGWTSDIGFYAQQPLAHDNVVYEVHGYPPDRKSYTYDNIPVIIGEYGSLEPTDAPAFYADLEDKQLSNLAWDFDPYSNCAPDLLEVDQSSTNLKPSAWGSLVQAYLLDHAK